MAKCNHLTRLLFKGLFIKLLVEGCTLLTESDWWTHYRHPDPVAYCRSGCT